MLHQNSSINQAQNQSNGHSVSADDPTDSNWHQKTIQMPFHLSQSNKYRQQTGFTNSISGEEISYSQINSIAMFSDAVRLDVAGAEFKNNYRGKQNFLRSDVLVFDVDNDGHDQDQWNDEGNWLTIEDFKLKFTDYEWMIATSLNHQKEKNGRMPRDKFHAFMALGSFVEDIGEYGKLLDLMQFVVSKDFHLNRIDSAVGGYSQIYGNQETQVFYNAGEPILHLLDSVRDDFEQQSRDKSQDRNIIWQQNGSDSIDISEFLQTWDYKNIISQYDLTEFYPTVVTHSNGYWMAKCELHDDQNPSLMIYDNGGFKCLSNQCQGNEHPSWSALDYVALKQNKSKTEVRKEYCDRLNLDYNDYIIETNSSDLEGYVPITNLGHIMVTFEDYYRLKELNQNHAICTIEGDVCVLLYTKASYHQEFGEGYKTILFQSRSDFREKFSNDFVQCKSLANTADDGSKTWSTKIQTLGKLWLEWDQRREYDRAHFHPADERLVYKDERVWDYFDDWSSASEKNNWLGEDDSRGLIRFIDRQKLGQITSNAQAEDACRLYQNHIMDILCGNYQGEKQRQLFEYIRYWMASALTKHLNNRTTVGLVLQSGQGSGKGLFSTFFGQLFGHYFYHLTDNSRLTQQFNMQMKDRLLVFADESVFAGDKRAVGTLKTMQTENTFTIEPKGVNAFVVNNHRRFIYSSNESWVINKEADDRRYQVIDVKNKKMTRGEYKRIEQQWNDGGKEGFYYLLKSDKIQDVIQDFDFEANMISTKAGLEQIKQSDPIIDWFYEILDNGGHYIWDFGRSICKWEMHEDNHFSTDKDAIYQSYVKYMETHGGTTWAKGKSQLSNRLSRLHEDGIIFFENSRDAKTAGNPTVWSFESIYAARKRWDKKFNDGEDSFHSA